jgi:hypothetical protein
MPKLPITRKKILKNFPTAVFGLSEAIKMRRSRIFRKRRFSVFRRRAILRRSTAFFLFWCVFTLPSALKRFQARFRGSPWGLVRLRRLQSRGNKINRGFSPRFTLPIPFRPARPAQAQQIYHFSCIP